jgi:hypothetical protein
MYYESSPHPIKEKVFIGVTKGQPPKSVAMPPEYMSHHKNVPYNSHWECL